jgi:hypothetical protein
VDLCRQSIVFTELSSLADCLNAIGSDPDVRVVRIKNRFDIDYDGQQTAGYRNVSLNLQISTSETKELGVDLHVCELQLQHIQYANIKVVLSKFYFR